MRHERFSETENTLALKYYDLFKQAILDHEHDRIRWRSQIRHGMLAEMQLKKELDEARELIDTLLQPVDKSKREY